MRIHQLQKFPDEAVMGKLPQIDPKWSTYYTEHPDRKPDFINFPSKELLEKAPDLNGFGFGPDRKVTDILNSPDLNANIGLFLSEKAKEVLETLRLGPHKFYPALVANGKGDPLPYFFLHLVVGENDVDYSNSTMSLFAQPTEVREVNSEQDVIDLQKQNVYLEAVTWQFNQAYDIFRFPFDSRIFISETAKSALEAADLLGLSISEATFTPAVNMPTS